MDLSDAGMNQRLPRFERHRFQKPPFAMTARDRNIIKMVSEHRAITSDDLRLLIPGSEQNLTRRLQRLYHHGYLDRPRSQRVLGNAPLVYALGDEGAGLLATGN